MELNNKGPSIKRFLGAGSVLARLKGHLFLNSTRQLQKLSSKTKLRLYEKRAGAG